MSEISFPERGKFPVDEEKRRLLVVDDETETADYLKEYFQGRGLEVVTTTSGEEGLRLISQLKPALVLLDIRLQGSISGIEVLRRARAAKTSSQIVVLTAVEDENIAAMAKGLGADGYLTKPFSLPDLEREVLSRLPAS